MRRDDWHRPSEIAKGGEPECPGACGGLDQPEPLHDQLEVRRLDASIAPNAVHCSDGALGDRHPASRDLVEHCFDEGFLDVDHGLAGQRGVPFERLHDRGSSGRPIEVVNANRIGEDRRELSREPVEFGQSVVSERDENIHS